MAAARSTKALDRPLAAIEIAEKEWRGKMNGEDARHLAEHDGRNVGADCVRDDDDLGDAARRERENERAGRLIDDGGRKQPPMRRRAQ